MCCLMMCASPITCKPIVHNAARSACEICSRMTSACDIPGDAPHEGSALSSSELENVVAELRQMGPSTAAESFPCVGYSLPVPAAAPAPPLAIHTLPPVEQQPPVEPRIPPASDPPYQRPSAHPSWMPDAVYDEVGVLRMYLVRDVM